MGPEESLFIATKERRDSPFCFNIVIFLALSCLCLSCPLKMFIRKNTKLMTLKVRKVYSYDPGSTTPLPPTALAEQHNDEEPVKESDGETKEVKKIDIVNELSSATSAKESNTNMTDKVLVDAALTDHESNKKEDKPTNRANVLNQDSVNNKTTESLIDMSSTQKMVLMSPMYGDKTVLLSPVYQSMGESRFVIIPVDTISADTAAQDKCRAVQLQSNLADRQTAELARQIKEKVGRKCEGKRNRFYFLIIVDCKTKTC